jgi:hypothetical protein
MVFILMRKGRLLYSPVHHIAPIVHAAARAWLAVLRSLADAPFGLDAMDKGVRHDPCSMARISALGPLRVSLLRSIIHDLPR